MQRKVLMVHDFSGKECDGKNLEEMIAERIREEGPGWVIHSATTSVAVCPQYNQHIHVQWCTTVVIEKK